MLEIVRDRVVGATTNLFSKGPSAMENTLDYRGDPGLCGPGSVSWAVIGDVAAFVGGIRALLVQTAHPEVVAGVAQHSSYEVDPLGRLARTSYYVTATTYGAMPEVDEAVAMVRAAHRPVRGHSERGRPYRAADPELAAWVHNVLTDSFLTTYRHFGRRALDPTECDRFVAEQAKVGSRLGAAPLPDGADALASWVNEHPALATSPEQRDVLRFLRRPPLPPGVSLGYRLLFEAAVATLPSRVREILALEPSPRGARLGRAATASLRWALGSSPAWHLALHRCDAPVPDGLFRQPLREA